MSHCQYSLRSELRTLTLTQDDRIEQCDDCQSEGPANSTTAQLVVVSLGPADSPHLVVVPASGEGEEADQQTEAGHELHGAADLEHIGGSGDDK